METERHAERARALRYLLAHPLTLAATNPDEFKTIARHRDWLTTWFADHPAWKLAFDAQGGFARLHKIPSGHDSTRAALPVGRADFDRRRYTLFCLALAAFDEVGAQTTLANLARRVTELAAEDTALLPFDSTSGSERRAFVDALRLLIELGVLRVREGDAERYAQARESDALFDINERLLSHLIAAPVPPAFANGPDQLLDEPWPDTDEGQRMRARNEVFRRLLDDPVLYFDELDTGAFAWLDRSRGWIYGVLENDAGFTVERRKEGLAAVDRSGITSDTSFPDGGSTAKHAAILLAEQLVRLHKRGTVLVARAEAIAITRKLQTDFGQSCKWSKLYPADEDGCLRLTIDAMRLLEGFGLVTELPDGWKARPAIARFCPGAPTRAPSRR